MSIVGVFHGLRGGSVWVTQRTAERGRVRVEIQMLGDQTVEQQLDEFQELTIELSLLGVKNLRDLLNTVLDEHRGGTHGHYRAPKASDGEEDAPR